MARDGYSRVGSCRVERAPDWCRVRKRRLGKHRSANGFPTKSTKHTRPAPMEVRLCTEWRNCYLGETWCVCSSTSFPTEAGRGKYEDVSECSRVRMRSGRRSCCGVD